MAARKRRNKHGVLDAAVGLLAVAAVEGVRAATAPRVQPGPAPISPAGVPARPAGPSSSTPPAAVVLLVLAIGALLVGGCVLLVLVGALLPSSTAAAPAPAETREATTTPDATPGARAAPPQTGGHFCNDGTPTTCTGKGCCSHHKGVAR